MNSISRYRERVLAAAFADELKLLMRTGPLLGILSDLVFAKHLSRKEVSAPRSFDGRLVRSIRLAYQRHLRDKAQGKTGLLVEQLG